MDVTAFLSTSAIITAIVGALGVPANAAEAPSSASASAWVSTSGAGATAASAPLVDLMGGPVPEPSIGGRPAPGTVDALAGLDGVALLRGISLLPPAQLAELRERHPGLVAELLQSPPAPLDVAALWAATPDENRSALATALPELVGNLEGVPYAARDDANRRLLADAAAGIRAQLDAGVGRAVAQDLEARLHMLGQVAEALRTGPSGEPRVLVSLDVTGEGRAVIAIGDLATADHVTFLVPGMYFGVDAQMVDWARTADAVLVEQRRWIERLGIDAEAATVAWIGYRTPTVVNVASMDLAREGQARFTASLQGLEAVRQADRPYLAVLAHSYGSTAALLSLQEDDVAVDAFAMAGSPGSPAASVRELNVADGNVWVAAAEWDPITASGLFGTRPLDESYGARHFGVSETVDPVTGARLAATPTHNDYFAPGSASMRNMALIALGRGELVTDEYGEAAVRLAKARRVPGA